MMEQKQICKRRCVVGTILASTAVLTVVFLVQAHGASDTRPVATNVTSTYNTEADATLAKDLVQIAKAESIKGKTPFDGFEIAIADVEFNWWVRRADQLEVSGGFVIAIDTKATGAGASRSVIPVRHIRYIKAQFATK